MTKRHFLTKDEPMLVCMVQAYTPERVEELMELSRPEGAEAFGMQFCRMKEQYKNKETFKKLFAKAGELPVYVTNYRQGENSKKSDGELAEGLIELAEYKDTFVDGVSALEYNNFGTLLIIVDANNFNILESPELARSAFTKVIIDHHIKKEEFEEEPALAYIDPSASSACELIAEMLEETLSPEASFKEEASIMMSGIMLDTKNFTRTVGMRTFAAALYLKNLGADTEYARTFFEEGFDEYLSASQFGSAAKIYRDNIAITSVADAGSNNARVVAAKAADKLLTIRNIRAAFALILVGSTVNISARSDGSINVQLILEQLGGGGHFDMAGAALADTTLEDAEAMLTAAIDKHFENIKAEKNENSNEN